MATYVLVHGSNQGGWIWQPVANRLRAAGHQVYAPSLDGCGERKGQMRPGISAETQADVPKVPFKVWRKPGCLALRSAGCGGWANRGTFVRATGCRRWRRSGEPILSPA